MATSLAMGRTVAIPKLRALAHDVVMVWVAALLEDLGLVALWALRWERQGRARLLENDDKDRVEPSTVGASVADSPWTGMSWATAVVWPPSPRGLR